jgi:methyl-accepting chemotaxis protein
MKKYKRKQYLVDRSFQFKYLALIICLLSIHTITVLAAVFGPTAYTLYSNATIEQKNEAAKSMLLLHSTIWPWIIAVMALFGLLSIFITHKTAGPLYRILSDLKDIEDGDYSARINLRKGDELTELSAQLNILIDKFNDSRKMLIEKNQAVIGKLAEMRLAVNSSPIDKLKIEGFIEQIERETTQELSMLDSQSE